MDTAANPTLEKPAVAGKPVHARKSAPDYVKGRRDFFKYRDLGVTAVTDGKIRAQVTIGSGGMTRPTTSTASVPAARRRAACVVVSVGSAPEANTRTCESSWIPPCPCELPTMSFVIIASTSFLPSANAVPSPLSRRWVPIDLSSASLRLFSSSTWVR